jgi:hypothetical protein
VAILAVVLFRTMTRPPVRAWLNEQ